MSNFSDEQLERYSRHIILPQIGGKGQEKLLASKVLIVGAGGLGSPAALYLAAAGVGTLGIMDGDVVDTSNLQRQILHATKDVGQLKVESAKETLQGINPDVEVLMIPKRINKNNGREIIKDFDIVLDCCDNFETRYLVNDNCILEGKPNVYGSIFRFEGQASLFLPKGPCYRCLFPQAPPPGLVPSCQEAGVLGILPGIIGTIQATEAIKYLVGIGTSMAGRLLLYDALHMSFREVEYKQDPSCPTCGKK